MTDEAEKLQEPPPSPSDGSESSSKSASPGSESDSPHIPSPPTSLSTAPAPPASSDLGQPQQYWQIKSDLHGVQRKSYGRENRWIKPSPVILCWTGPPDAHVVGKAEVFLVAEGEPVRLFSNQEALEGARQVAINGEREAVFHLKMTATTDREHVRLMFRIHFRVGSGGGDDSPEFTSRVLSAPFRVESKKQRDVFKVPHVLGVVPSEGGFVASTVAWIRGRDFLQTPKNIAVSFGGIDARVVEVGPSYVFAEVPNRKDLTARTAVEVKVGNVYGKHGTCWSTDSAIFSYDEKTPVAIPAVSKADLKPQSPAPLLLLLTHERRDEQQQQLPQQQPQPRREGLDSHRQPLSVPPVVSPPAQISPSPQPPAGPAKVVDCDGNTELTYACASGELATAIRLVRAGSNINTANRFGDNPLIYACAHSHPRVAAFLLSNGANPRVRNRDAETPLHYAALVGDDLCAQLLIEHGAEVDCQGFAKFTPLHNAVWRRHPIVVSRLLHSGANPNAATADGHTTLHLACASPPDGTPAGLDIIAPLLASNADIRIPDAKEGALPVHLYARAAQPKELEVLLRAYNAVVEGLKTSIATVDRNGQSVLHYAAAAGNASAVALLVSWPRDRWPGVSVEARTFPSGGSRTALHLAAASKSVDAVRLLVEQGHADHNARDADNKLPADYSATPEVFRYLSSLH